MSDLTLSPLKHKVRPPIKKVIIEGSKFLSNFKIYNSKNEIEWFLQKLYNCNKFELYNIRNEKITHSAYQSINQFLTKRAQHVPFQYLIGAAPFYDKNFIVSPKTLIPRPETEILIDIIKNKKVDKLLDIGTGCGCLAIIAKLKNIAEKIDAIDISQGAIDIAKKNAAQFNIKDIQFKKMNILTKTPLEHYDLILSNPPYISYDEYKNLHQEIINYEPSSALTDFKSGYDFYIRYSKIFKKILKKDGLAVLEISQFFSIKKIKDIFQEFKNIKFYKDLNKNYRAISISG